MIGANSKKVIASFFVSLLVAVTLCGCGAGGGNSTPLANTTTPIYTSAPATITLNPGQTSNFTVGGGGGGLKFTTYSASSSNTLIAIATISGTSFSITGASVGTAVILVQDTAGNTVKIDTTVSTPGGTGSTGGTLYIAAPTAVSVAQAHTNTYTVGGGSGGYIAASSDSAVVIATIAGSSLTINGVSPGYASVVVFDSAGTSTKLSVNVSGTNGVQLFYTTTPTPLVLTTGSTPTYTIFGGVLPYTVTSSNQAVVTGLISDRSLTLSALIAGVSTLNIFDANGAKIPVDISVVSTGTNNALFTTAPAAVVIGIGKGATYTIGGGTAPYTATSANTTAVTASVVGNQLMVTGNVAAATVEVVTFDSTGTAVHFNVTVN